MDISALSQALLSSVALRDKVVVVRLDPTGVEDHLEDIARSLALLRALDLRVIVIHGPRTPQRRAAKQPPLTDVAPQLIAAIARYEQRAVAVLPHGVIQVLPMVPFPLVDQALLIQLCSLRYIPVLMMSADLAADQVAATVGKFLDAALVVHLQEGKGAASSPPRVEGEPRTIHLSAASTDKLLAELLLKAADPADPRGNS